MESKKIVLYVRDSSGELHKMLEEQREILMNVPTVKEAIEEVSSLTMSCQLEMSQDCYEALMEQCAMFQKLQDFEEHLDKIPDEYFFIEPLEHHERQSFSVCKSKCWTYNKRRKFKPTSYWKRIRSRTW